MKDFLALLFFLLASGCHAITEYECGYDTIANNSGEMPVTIVQEVPAKGKGAWQAYTVARDSRWAPIRFKFFTEDLNDPRKFCGQEGQMRPNFKEMGQMIICTTRDILSSEKREILVNSLLPEALRLHADRLMVRPVTGVIVLPQYWRGFCAAFTAPPSHYKSGVWGADMLLYVAAGQTLGLTAAWAGTCSRERGGRPVVGFANFGPHAIASTHSSIRVAAHEIGHALGFDINVMVNNRMVTFVRLRGTNRNVVTSPLTLAMTRNHYGCDTAPGMELENEGGSGTANSHWERRNAKDELMTGMGNNGGLYTALTMAFYEDTGFYKAIWGREERMDWAYRSGCSFLTRSCVENGRTRFPDMFCTDNDHGLLCTSDRRALGRCHLSKFRDPLPREFQYFQSPDVGGSPTQLTDFCPIVQAYSNGMCHNGRGLPGNRFGPSSMCLKGEGLRMYGLAPGDVCAEVQCSNGRVMMRYDSDENWYPCPEGKMIKPRGDFIGGYIVCPNHFDVCPSNNDDVGWNPSTVSRRNLREFEDEHTGEIDGAVSLGRVWTALAAASAALLIGIFCTPASPGVC